MATTQTLEENYQLRHHVVPSAEPHQRTVLRVFRVHEVDYDRLAPGIGDASAGDAAELVTGVRRSQRAGAVWCLMYVTYVKQDAYT
jgi:hypothetical protein